MHAFAEFLPTLVLALDIFAWGNEGLVWDLESRAALDWEIGRLGMMHTLCDTTLLRLCGAASTLDECIFLYCTILVPRSQAFTSRITPFPALLLPPTILGFGFGLGLG